MNEQLRAISTALAAAALFGAATPVAKLLLGSTSPFMVAGLFYLGSGAGLGLGIALRAFRMWRADFESPHQGRRDTVASRSDRGRRRCRPSAADARALQHTGRHHVAAT